MNKTKTTHNKLIRTITPEIVIKIPAILFTHFKPTRSNLFLKSITPELRDRNHKKDPIKTPRTSADPEKRITSSPKPSAANTAIKAKMVKGLVIVIKKAVRYDLKVPCCSQESSDRQEVYEMFLYPGKEEALLQPDVSRSAD